MPVIHETERQDMELLRPSNTTIWPLQGFRDGKWQICHSRREALQSAWQKFAVLTSSPGASEFSTLAEADSADGQLQRCRCLAFSTVRFLLTIAKPASALKIIISVSLLVSLPITVSERLSLPPKAWIMSGKRYKVIP